MQLRSRALLVFAARASAALLVTLASCAAGIAHDAPSGWAYDRGCCSGHDCNVDSGKITPIDQGWLIERHGLVIPYKSFMLHKSKDGLFHSCWLQGDDTRPENLLCLYVPPMGS